jgi:hypothetical protein
MLLLLAAACCVVYGLRRDDRIDRLIGQVQAESPAENAVRLLGTPSWRGACESRFPYGAERDCNEEIVYASSFAPLKPIYWSIQVGRRGQVLRAESIGSP